MQSKVDVVDSTLPSGQASIVDFLILVVFSVLLTVMAVTIYPVWVDDSVANELMRKHADLAAAQADRPLIGHVISAISKSGYFIVFALGIYFVTWCGAAIVTLFLWMQLFRDVPQLGVAAAALTLAPVVSQGQYVLLNFPITSLLGPVLVFSILPLLLTSVRLTLKVATAYFLAFFVVYFSVQLSEYAIPSAMAVALIILAPSRFTTITLPNRSRFAGATVLLSAAVVSYLIYRAGADPLARQRVRPEYFLDGSVLWRVKVLLPLVVSQVWTATIGSVSMFLGELSIRTKYGLAAALAGMLTSAIVVARSWISTFVTDSNRPFSHSPTPPRILFLLSVLAISVFPMCLMGANSMSRLTSRFLLPMLPLASCIIVATGGYALRRRLWWIIPAFAGFAFGYGHLQNYLLAQADRAQLQEWSEQIRAEMPLEGICVAVFCERWNQSDFLSGQFELTTCLTNHWPERERERFWAFGALDQITTDNGRVDLFSKVPAIDLNIRGVGIHGEISTVLWIRHKPDGSLVIEKQAFAPPRKSSRNAA